MKVLHLCSYYIGNKLYSNMMRAFNTKKNLENIVFIPIRSIKYNNKNFIPLNNIKYIYRDIIKPVDRLLFHRKVFKITKEIKENIDITTVDVVHTHSLFTDGVPAYKIFKKYGVKYIVTVRNTDLNYFFKYQKHLKQIGIQTLLNAERIIFLSNNYKESIYSIVPQKYRTKFLDKSVVIPNGLSTFWLENKRYKPKDIKEDALIKLLFVGEINENKNIETLVRTISKYDNYHLDIAGSGPLTTKISEIIKQLEVEERIKLYGKCEQQELLKLYDKNDIFVLPSKKETFGIVYLEAMSQGLPIIYTKGEGFDSLYDNGYLGYRIDSKLTEFEIIIENIKKNYRILSNNTLNEIDNFSWDEITNKYKTIYEEIKSEKYLDH